MNKNIQIGKYIIADFLAATISWALFYSFRKTQIEYKIPNNDTMLVFDEKFILGIVIIPFAWILLHYCSGYYNDIFRKSRFNEFGQTLLTTFIGVIIIFFAILLDDSIDTYKNYYYSFFVLLGFQFFITYIPRLIITSNTTHNIQKGKIQFNTLLIGENRRALEIFKEIQNQRKKTGDNIVGYVNLHYNGKYNYLDNLLPYLGDTNNLHEIINTHKIEDVIIAMDTSEHQRLNEILSRLAVFNVNIKIIPDMYDILTGSVKMYNIYGTPLIQVSHTLMPEWQKSVKQVLDIVISLLALFLSLPISIILAIAIKLSSPGPVFYSHERIGKNGKPFRIYKFRSMYVDAEKNGPELASRNDKRTTWIGRFMRRTRLDEIPNFVNVLKGDMSIVGPRPERQYYIDQIIKKAPQYLLVQRIKPGITSLGQVKYGYAENVEQMIKRLRFDLLYIENMSLYMDIKIMVYTILTIIRGHGI